MNRVGSIEVLVTPTVELESAIACIIMLNLFIKSDEEHMVVQHDDGTLEIVEVDRS